MSIGDARACAARIAGAFPVMLLSFVLALSLCLPTTAFADVKKTDTIMGQTVADLGLTSSQCPNIDASYALVCDADGTVYFERDAYSSTKIASITKVMTALVALGYADLGTEISVSSTAAAIGESSADLQSGDTLDLKSALTAMLVSSGNDAAEAIGESLGKKMLSEKGESSDDASKQVQAFVDAMNQKASDLGMTGSLFRNPHGLDTDQFAGDQHSCAADVSTMVKEAMKNQTFRDIVCQATATIQVTRDGGPASLSLTSTDTMLGSYQGACGVKTGFTDAAGGCFAAASNRGGGDLYAIVLGSTDETTRFTAAETLLDWVYSNETSYKLANSNQTVNATIDGENGNYPIVAEVAHTGWIDKTVKGTIENPSQTISVFSLGGNISDSASYDALSGDVKVGDKIGTLTFKQRNEVVATVDIVAAEDVAAPNFLEGIGVWFNRLFLGLSNQNTVAESVLVNTTPLLVDKTATAS